MRKSCSRYDIEITYLFHEINDIYQYVDPQCLRNCFGDNLTHIIEDTIDTKPHRYCEIF